MALEQSARLDTVVFDKTGTLTRRRAERRRDRHGRRREDELLRLVAAVERESEHPLAEAIVAEAGARGIELPRAEASRASPATARVARVEGHRLAVGNARLMEREGVEAASCAPGARLAEEGRTIVHVAIDGRLAGLIAIADAPRPTAPAAIGRSASEGLEPVLLTGDNRRHRRAASPPRWASTTCIAEVLPGDKAAKVAELQAAGRRVAMVGDGVNDAPALAQADVGIAIGAGTDVAVETADVVLMRSDPLDVATAVTIGRGTVRKMRQNLGWAIGYNSLALPIAAGVFEPWGLTLRPEIAAITMAGSSIIVAVNALALKRLRLPAGRIREAEADQPASGAAQPS